MEAVLTGEIGTYTCPVRLNIYGPNDSAQSEVLKTQLKVDKLIPQGTGIAEREKKAREKAREKERKEEEPGDPEAPAQSPRKPKPKGGRNCHGSSDVDTRSESVLGADMLNLFNDEADADDEVKEKGHRGEPPARKSKVKSVERTYSNSYKCS